MNSSPVAGGLTKAPTAAMATRCNVSGVSVDRQLVPTTSVPPTHSVISVGEPDGVKRIEPVKSMPVGLRTDELVASVISNPFSLAEPLM